MIDSQQASAALDDINDVVRRVRQSQIYQLSSLIIVIWGVLVFAAYIANYIWPRQGYAIWTVANLIGLVVTIAIGVISNVRPGARAFPIRSLTAAFLLWMAIAHGGGLVLGGLWMRRI